MAEAKRKQDEEKKPACANHPDREATFETDGVAHEVLHLCDECVPAHWR